MPRHQQRDDHEAEMRCPHCTGPISLQVAPVGWPGPVASRVFDAVSPARIKRRAARKAAKRRKS